MLKSSFKVANLNTKNSYHLKPRHITKSIWVLSNPDTVKITKLLFVIMFFLLIMKRFCQPFWTECKRYLKNCYIFKILFVNLNKMFIIYFRIFINSHYLMVYRCQIFMFCFIWKIFLLSATFFKKSRQLQFLIWSFNTVKPYTYPFNGINVTYLDFKPTICVLLEPAFIYVYI